MKLPTLTGVEIRLIGAFLLLVGFFVAYLSWHAHVFNAGMAAQRAEDQKALDNNRKIFGDTAIRVDWVGNLASAERIRLQQVTIHEVDNVTKVVHDHPELSAVYRPAELERLRAESLAQVRAAADQSAAAARGRDLGVPRAGERSPEQPAKHDGSQ